MKKTIFIALGMALALFLYGYLASTVGHDHSSHGYENTQVQEEHTEHEHQH